MRKITSKYQEQKKQKRNAAIAGIVLVGLMLVSILGYSFQREDNSETEKITYNGLEFTSQNGYWKTKIGENTFLFRYNPNQIEEMTTELNSLNIYKSKPLYLSSENDAATSEIYTNLFYQNSIVQRMQFACLEESCGEEIPIKTCEDNFIIIKENETLSITQEENCVFIQGPEEALAQITDEFLFQLLKVRK